jgi:RNA polymerase sigma factor (sigma-70 family)
MTGMKTDADLIRASKRDARPFRELYDRYAERIDSYHRRRSGSADAALDLTAETFARAWERRGAFRDEAGGSAGPWLFAIARNVLLESVRRGRIERASSERLRLEREPSGVVPEEQWLDGLDEALGSLPEAQRSAVELRVLGDLEYDQLADALETTPLAARVRVSRGLAALRNHFEKRMEAAG